MNSESHLSMSTTAEMTALTVEVANGLRRNPNVCRMSLTDLLTDVEILNYKTMSYILRNDP